MERELIVIAGPTAAGKSRIALELAEEMNGEIVSCDSMQLYRFMDIGSAKPSPEDLARVPHHLVGVIDPKEPFSVARYRDLAREAIEGIFSRGRRPFLVGGTGLYLNALLYEMDFAGAAPDPALRQGYETLAKERGAEALHKVLAGRHPESAARIHPNNLKRVIRALETLDQTGKSTDAFKRTWEPVRDYHPRLAGISCERRVLWERINKRVDEMMAQGLLDEVRGLLDRGLTLADPAMLGIGYKELAAHLLGVGTLEEAVQKIKLNTRHLAKRQMTWFRRYPEMVWFDLTREEDTPSVLEDMRRWLSEKN
jgi:tRNA dimethylallyltransferase